MRQFLCGACDHFTAVCPSCECPILAGDYAEVGAGLFRGYPTLRASHQSEPALRIVGKTIRLTEEKSTPIITSAIGKWISTTCCACFAKTTVFMSNGCKVAPRSLHDDFARHLRMNRAEVRIRSRFAEGEGELFVCVEHFGLERLRIIRANYRVRDIVTVGPRNRGPDRHR